MTYLFIIIAASIIIGLGVYAGRLVFLLKQQNAKQQQVRNDRIESMVSSINTIAFAMQQNQCDLSEGTIRICRLLESLPIDPLPNYANTFPAIHTFFDAIAHFPTHEARQALSKQERRTQDNQREALESQYESAIQQELTTLRTFSC